jgi:hypothetical protein
VFPVRYEHHLHIKNVKLSPSQVVKESMCVSCEVRTSSTYNKSRAIPLTDHEGEYVCFL